MFHSVKFTPSKSVTRAPRTEREELRQERSKKLNKKDRSQRNTKRGWDEDQQ